VLNARRAQKMDDGRFGLRKKRGRENQRCRKHKTTESGPVVHRYSSFVLSRLRRYTGHERPEQRIEAARIILLEPIASSLFINLIITLILASHRSALQSRG